jgi:hypothetical protein
MARARNIKPGFFKNEILGVADPLLSLLFEGLWILADRAGKLEDRPLRIKGEVFPYREGIDMESMLDWLQSNGFIRRYVVAGKRYILVLEFVKHQNPHKNETASDIPDPEEIRAKPEIVGSTRADSLSTDSLIPDSLHSVPNGTDGDAVIDAEALTKAELWTAGKSLLASQGMAKAQCGSFVGKLVKDYGDAVVIGAVRAAVVKRPPDVAEYLVGICQHASGQRKQAEPGWRAEQRERTQLAAPGVAATQSAAEFFIDVEAKNVTPHALAGPNL